MQPSRRSPARRKTVWRQGLIGGVLAIAAASLGFAEVRADNGSLLGTLENVGKTGANADDAKPGASDRGVGGTKKDLHDSAKDADALGSGEPDRQLPQKVTKVDLPPLALSLPPTRRGASLGIGSGFEGNWSVEWDNSPDNEEKLGLFMLSKGWEYGCPGKESCYLHFFHVPGVHWKLDGTALSREAGSQKWERDATEPKLGRNGFNIKHDYYVLGYGGAVESVRGEMDQTELHGEWHYGDNGGKSVWRRVVPVVESYTFGVKTDDEWQYFKGLPGGEVPRVEVPWNESRWGRGNDMRGNRPRFTVWIKGKNFWGLQYPWIDSRTGLEISNPWHICADGDGFRYGYWYPCIEKNGADGAVGLGFELIIWPGVTPGPKTLYINGVAIPFDLVINDYPELPPEVDSVAALSRDGVPLENIRFDEPFELLAHLDRPAKPGEISALEITAETDRNSIVIDGELGGDAKTGAVKTAKRRQTVWLHPTSDPQLYRGRTPFTLSRKQMSTEPAESGNRERSELGSAFAGHWEVTHIDDQEKPFDSGKANITGDGEASLELKVGGPWYAVGVKTNRFRQGSGPFTGSTEMEFEKAPPPAATSSSACSEDFLEALAEAGETCLENSDSETSRTETFEAIRLADAASQIEFHRDTGRARLKIIAERLNVKLRSKEKDLSKLEGTWELQDANGRPAKEGYATWLRELDFAGTIRFVEREANGSEVRFVPLEYMEPGREFYVEAMFDDAPPSAPVIASLETSEEKIDVRLVPSAEDPKVFRSMPLRVTEVHQTQSNRAGKSAEIGKMQPHDRSGKSR